MGINRRPCSLIASTNSTCATVWREWLRTQQSQSRIRQGQPSPVLSSTTTGQIWPVVQAAAPPFGWFFFALAQQNWGICTPDTVLKEEEGSAQAMSNLHTHALTVTWPPTPPPVAQTHRNGALREQRALLWQPLGHHGAQTPSLHDLLRLTLKCQSTPIRRTGTTPAVPSFPLAVVVSLPPSSHRAAPIVLHKKQANCPPKKFHFPFCVTLCVQ